MISIRLRGLYRRLSYLMEMRRDCRPGMRGLWLFLQSIPEAGGVIAVVAQQPLRLGQTGQQCGSAGLVADLARAHEEAERVTACIGDGVNLGAHVPFV